GLVGAGLADEELPDLAANGHRGVAIDGFQPGPIEQLAHVVAHERSDVVASRDGLRMSIVLAILPDRCLVSTCIFERLEVDGGLGHLYGEIGRADVCTPVTSRSRMTSSA